MFHWDRNAWREGLYIYDSRMAYNPTGRVPTVRATCETTASQMKKNANVTGAMLSGECNADLWAKDWQPPKHSLSCPHQCGLPAAWPTSSSIKRYASSLAVLRGKNKTCTEQDKIQRHTEEQKKKNWKLLTLPSFWAFWGGICASHWKA